MSAIRDIGEPPLRLKMKYLQEELKDDLTKLRNAREAYKADPTPLNEELLRMAKWYVSLTKKAIRRRLGLH